MKFYFARQNLFIQINAFRIDSFSRYCYNALKVIWRPHDEQKSFYPYRIVSCYCYYCNINGNTDACAAKSEETGERGFLQVES